MTKTATMLDLGHELAEIRRAVAAVTRYVLSPLQDRETKLRAALQTEMREHGTKTLDVAGLQVQRRITTGPQIIDEELLVEALKEVGLYDSCLKWSLDRALVKKIGAAHEMPGIEYRETETIAIGTSKQPADAIPF